MYEFINDSGYDFEEIPAFAEIIFKEPYLTNETKEEFKRTILDRYFSDDLFKEILDEGKVVVFLNDKLQRIYDSVDSTKGISKMGDDVRLFPTTNKFGKTLNSQTIYSMNEKEDGRNNFKCFNVDVTTSILNDSGKLLQIGTCDYTFDSGAEITTFIPVYQKYISRSPPFEFKEYPIGITNPVYAYFLHKPFLLELNKLIPKIVEKKFVGSLGPYDGCELTFEKSAYLELCDVGVTPSNKFSISKDISVTIPPLYGIDNIHYYKSIMKMMGRNFSLIVSENIHDKDDEIENLKITNDRLNESLDLQDEKIKGLEKIIRCLSNEINDKDNTINLLRNKLENA